MWSAIAGSPARTRIASWRLRALRSDLIDPTIAVHHGRIVKRTGDGSHHRVPQRRRRGALRHRSSERHGRAQRRRARGPSDRVPYRHPPRRRRRGSDGDLMGDGVNIAARLESVAGPGAICLSEDAYRQVKARLDLAVTDLGATQLKNIADPIRVYSLQVGLRVEAKPAGADAAATPPRPRYEQEIQFCMTSRRSSTRLFAHGRRAAAGQDRKLDDASRIRFREPNLATSLSRTVARPHADPLRRTRQRPLGP